MNKLRPFEGPCMESRWLPGALEKRSKRSPTDRLIPESAMLASFDDASLGLAVLNEDRQTLWVNRAARRLLRQPTVFQEIANVIDAMTHADVEVAEAEHNIHGSRYRTTVSYTSYCNQAGCLLLTFSPLHRRPEKHGLALILTPTERRLVECLCDGLNVKEAAAQLGIAYNTARKYLQHIFQKTGARRQNDLVAMVLSEKRK